VYLKFVYLLALLQALAKSFWVLLPALLFQDDGRMNRDRQT